VFISNVFYYLFVNIQFLSLNNELYDYKLIKINTI